jgi:hypothetical protein
MAKLTTKARKALPSKDFAGPGRSYPVENRSHAIAAKGRATQQWTEGKLSASARDKIVAKANQKLKR